VERIFSRMEKMRVEGRIWKFGDDVDTDVIIPHDT